MFVIIILIGLNVTEINKLSSIINLIRTGTRHSVHQVSNIIKNNKVFRKVYRKINTGNKLNYMQNKISYHLQNHISANLGVLSLLLEMY